MTFNLVLRCVLILIVMYIFLVSTSHNIPCISVMRKSSMNTWKLCKCVKKWLYCIIFKKKREYILKGKIDWIWYNILIHLNCCSSQYFQENRVRLPVEAIFFAISLLQFFKIKFGKFGGIINILDWLHWKFDNHIGTQLSFLKLIHLYKYIIIQHLNIQTIMVFRI